MRIAFVTNLPSHFHNKVFETIARHFDTDFFFFSDGEESWIERKNALSFGNYNGEYASGIRLTSRYRINTTLVRRLFNGRYDCLLSSVNGRFELLATYLTAKILGKPFVLWTNLWFHPDTAFHRLTFPIVKHIYRNADAIVAYGYHVSKYLESLGINPNKVFFSWNVVDNDLFRVPVSKDKLDELRSRLHLTNRHVLLFVGRHSEEKGLTYLLEAYRLLPPSIAASLLLIGDGEEKEILMKYVADHQLEHVHFLGHIPNAELLQYYALADIFVLPSVTTRTLKEVWGIVLNEAMNQGCPVVATTAVGAAVGGLVIEGKNGVVVPERDAVALRDAIARLFADPKRLSRMKEYTQSSILAWDHVKSYEGFRAGIAYAVSENLSENTRN